MASRRALRALARERAARDVSMIERESVAEEHPDLTEADLGVVEEELVAIAADLRLSGARLRLSARG
jgi:hypothetical protein